MKRQLLTRPLRRNNTTRLLEAGSFSPNDSGLKKLYFLLLVSIFHLFTSDSLIGQGYQPVKPTNIIDPTLAVNVAEYEVEQLYSHIKDSNGNVYLAGAAGSSNFIMKLGAANLSAPEWTIKINGGKGFEGIRHIFLGKDGNINAITVNIEPTQDVDPGPAVVNVSAVRISDIILLTYKPDGSYVSYKKLTETSGGNAYGNPYISLTHATNDADGNFYLYGSSYIPNNSQITGTRDFDAGAGTVNIMNSDFLVKYDLTGKCHWAHPVAAANRVFTDLKHISGALYFTGRFGGAGVDFEFGAGEYLLNQSTTSSVDIFLAKYLPATGTIDWAFGIGSSGWNEATTIMEESDGIRLFGSYYKSIDFDPSAAVSMSDNIASNNNFAFTSKYDFDGKFVDAKRLSEGYLNNISITSATKDNKNNFYITGAIVSSGSGIDLDISNKSYAVYLGNQTYYDGLVAKYDQNFKIKFGFNLGFYGSSDYASEILMINPDGSRIMVVGSYKSSYPTNVDFDPNSGVLNLRGTRGSEELYAVTYCHLPETFPTPSNTWVPYVQQGQTGVVYSIDPITGATGYNWTLPAGFTITSGENTNSITVSASATAAGGAIVVKGKNDCGETEHYSFNVATGTKSVPTITNFSDMSKDYATGSLVFQANSVSTGPISYTLMETSNNVKLTGNTLEIYSPGKYKIRATIEEDDNYGKAVKDIVLTVNKGDYETVFENITKTYGASPFTLAANALKTSGEIIQYSILPGGTGIATLSGTNNSTATISQAGTVKIRAVTLESDYFRSDTVEAVLTINKATAYLGITNLSTTYSGRTQIPTIGFSPTDLTGVKTVYKLGENVVGSPVNVGSYTVETTLDHVNYQATPVTKTFTINRAGLTVSIPNATKAYRAPNPEIVLSYSGFVNNEKVDVIDQLPTVWINVNQYSAPGIYDIHLSGGADNNYYFSAVAAKLTIVKATQTITFPEIADKNVNESPIPLFATSSAEQPITYQIVSGPATVNGNYVYFQGSLGTITVRAIQAGSTGYEAATPVERTFKITNKLNQTISFDAIADKVYGDASFTLQATGGQSAEPVVFSVASGNVEITAGNKVTITGAGSATIRASQAGNDQYNSAGAIERSFNIAKASQTITFPQITSLFYTTTPVNLRISATNPGIPVEVTVVEGNASIVDGNKVRLGGLGSVTIKASQPGNDNFSKAEDVIRTFTVIKSTQTITFPEIAEKVVGDPDFQLEVTGGGSGIPVSLAVVSGPAELLPGNMVRLTGAGTVTIKATQAGDEYYKAAADVERTFTVKKKVRNISIAGIQNKVFGADPFSVEVTGDATNESVSFAVLSGSATISAQGLVEISGAGSVTVQATLAGDESFEVAIAEATFVVEKASQIINFDVIADQIFGVAPIGLSASSSIGLEVRYSISDGNGEVIENSLSISGPGKITVRAWNDGNDNYLPATAVQTFCVAPSKPLITTDGTPTSAAFTLKSSSSVGNQWFKNGEQIDGATGDTYNVTAGGVYSVMVTIGGCSNVSDNIVLTANENPVAKENIAIYPTITKDEVTIDLQAQPKGKVTILVWTESGKLLKKSELTSKTTKLDLRPYAAGMYLIQVQNQLATSTFKIIKQ